MFRKLEIIIGTILLFAGKRMMKTRYIIFKRLVLIKCDIFNRDLGRDI